MHRTEQIHILNQQQNKQRLNKLAASINREMISGEKPNDINEITATNGVFCVYKNESGIITLLNSKGSVIKNINTKLSIRKVVCLNNTFCAYFKNNSNKILLFDTNGNIIKEIQPCFDILAIRAINNLFYAYNFDGLNKILLFDTNGKLLTSPKGIELNIETNKVISDDTNTLCICDPFSASKIVLIKIDNNAISSIKEINLNFIVSGVVYNNNIFCVYGTEKVLLFDTNGNVMND